MKIFIWKGNNISDAYHDDGTLVVLANTAGEARAIVRQAVRDRQFMKDEWMKKRDELMLKHKSSPQDFWQSPEGKELWKTSYPSESEVFDGRDSALDREPDEVLDVDIPKLVAFNGGGYD